MPPDGPGVYFLIRDDQIVYIGASAFPGNRARSHGLCGGKCFHSVVFLAVDEAELITTESHWIRTICPVHNKQHNPDPDDSCIGWGQDPTRDDWSIKLPPKYRDGLIAAKKITGREMTTSGQIALEMYFRAIGVTFTPNWPDISNKPD